MRRSSIATAPLMLAVLLAALETGVAAAPAGSAGRAPAIAYPATEPGRHAREYFPAYNGDEAAMRAYFAAHVGAEDLKARPIDVRIGIWHQIRENQGTLTPVRVIESGDDFVSVLVRSGGGETLAMRFLCRDSSPHTLLGIRIEPAEENVGGAGGPRGPGANAPPPPAGPPPTDDAIVADLSAQLDSLVHSTKFSGAVLLDKGGKTLFSGAYGMANRRLDRANDIETRFNLASINKIFTHVAVLQLEQRGKLKLDDTIDRYLKDYPKASAKQITIRMLLEHRAGVPDVLESEGAQKTPERLRTAQDWYAQVRGEPLRFKPGTRQEYSNGGFAMLGMIIQRVSGEDYYDYVRGHIYGPAGMTRTESDFAGKSPDNTAAAYTRDRAMVHGARGDDTAEPAEIPRELGRGSAAGGGYSTVGDMLRFARALREHRLLDAEHTQRIIGKDAGLGIAGGSPGVNALLELAGPYTLVVLANLDPPAAERFAHTTGRMMRAAAPHISQR